MQIFRRSHDRELNGTLVAERLVGPFSDGADLLDGRNTVVGNENLDTTIVRHGFPPFASKVIRTEAHRTDNGVTVVLSDKVLDDTRGCSVQVVTANEVRGNVGFGRQRAGEAICGRIVRGAHDASRELCVARSQNHAKSARQRCVIGGREHGVRR